MAIFKPRTAVQVDWEAERLRSDVARAEQARVDREAREAAARFRGPVDPLAALVERVAAFEQKTNERLDALEQRVALEA